MKDIANAEYNLRKKKKSKRQAQSTRNDKRSRGSESHREILVPEIELQKDNLNMSALEPIPTITEGASYIDLDVESEGQKHSKMEGLKAA